MKNHYQLSDIEFETQFTSCTLDSSLFTHEAHVRLAWIFIKKYDILEAENNIQQLIKNFVAHLGAEDKYHATLTVAAIKIVYHFMQKTDIITFRDFVDRYTQLNTNFKELLAMHYSFDIFNSEEAKFRFITPDLLPFA